MEYEYRHISLTPVYSIEFVIFLVRTECEKVFGAISIPKFLSAHRHDSLYNIDLYTIQKSLEALKDRLFCVTILYD